MAGAVVTRRVRGYRTIGLPILKEAHRYSGLRTGCAHCESQCADPPPTPPSQGGEAVRGRGDPLTPPLAKATLLLPPCEGGVEGGSDQRLPWCQSKPPAVSS